MSDEEKSIIETGFVEGDDLCALWGHLEDYFNIFCMQRTSFAQGDCLLYDPAMSKETQKRIKNILKSTREYLLKEGAFEEVCKLIAEENEIKINKQYYGTEDDLHDLLNVISQDKWKEYMKYNYYGIARLSPKIISFLQQPTNNLRNLLEEITYRQSILVENDIQELHSHIRYHTRFDYIKELAEKDV